MRRHRLPDLRSAARRDPEVVFAGESRGVPGVSVRRRPRRSRRPEIRCCMAAVCNACRRSVERAMRASAPATAASASSVATGRELAGAHPDTAEIASVAAAAARYTGRPRAPPRDAAPTVHWRLSVNRCVERRFRLQLSPGASGCPLRWFLPPGTLSSRNELGHHDELRERPTLSSDSGSDQRAGPRAARDGAADDGSSRPGVRRLGTRGARRAQADLQDAQSRHHLSRVGHGCVGSRARQHAVARRPSPDVRDRLVRVAVARDGRQARPAARAHSDRLAPRRRSGRHRGPPRAGSRARDQSRLRRAQRDVDGCRQPHRRGAQGDRSRASSGVAARRHDLVARLGRLPHGRVGRRRDRGRLAEGAHAAAGLVVQRRSRRARSR